MRHLDHAVTRSKWEAPFQIALLILVFIFYSFDGEGDQIQAYQVVFFLNYVLAVLVINYILLPSFFYRGKYWYFFLSALAMVFLVMLIEEFVLEKIYFPDTRGRTFQGIFYGLLDVLPVIMILSGFKFAWDLIRKQQEVEELRNSMEESELKFLKNQINPHFLFNNLNNLYAYALEGSPKTPVIILEMSSVLRYMLYDCREKYVPLETELKQLTNFIKLNELQIEERGQVNFNIPEIQGGGYRVAPLILMVFVENAFKHSTASQSEDIRIDISVNLDEKGQLQFSCSNTYKEISNDESLSKGIGMENVRKRLELIYPGAHELTVRSSDDRYEVQLVIGLN